jgi:hypothetical protein
VLLTQIVIPRKRAKLDDEQHPRDHPAGLVLAAWRVVVVDHQEASIDVRAAPGKPQAARMVPVSSPGLDAVTAA